MHCKFTGRTHLHSFRFSPHKILINYKGGKRSFRGKEVLCVVLATFLCDCPKLCIYMCVCVCVCVYYVYTYIFLKVHIETLIQF